MKSWKSVNAGWYGSIDRKRLPKIVVTEDGIGVDKNDNDKQVEFAVMRVCVVS